MELVQRIIIAPGSLCVSERTSERRVVRQIWGSLLNRSRDFVRQGIGPSHLLQFQ